MVSDLDVVDSSELQPGTDLEGGLEQGILIFDIVENGEVLGDEADLGLDDISLMVVPEGELELGEGIEELAGDLVEENGGVAVELGGDSYGRPPREGECGLGGG